MAARPGQRTMMGKGQKPIAQQEQSWKQRAKGQDSQKKAKKSAAAATRRAREAANATQNDKNGGHQTIKSLGTRIVKQNKKGAALNMGQLQHDERTERGYDSSNDGKHPGKTVCSSLTCHASFF